ncbi:hypothetical protein [Actinocrispum sp. NPDC049592]|uniref:hypothetical protein n=1 Tax=Actinocrispum sp. NPDC049592 TaxID=3154835 RepID=UPI00342B03B9
MKQRPTRRPRVAGHNRRSAAPETPEVTDSPGATASGKAADAAEAAVGRPTATEASAETIDAAEASSEAVDSAGAADVAEGSGTSVLEAEEAPGSDLEAVDSDAVEGKARWPFALIIAAALLVGAGAFFLVRANTVDSGVDTRGMTEVNGQVKDAVEKIFSFSYDKVDESSAAARQVLAGTAVQEYDKLIAQVREQAPSQKLVLATRVTDMGVKSIDGDHAELLVFLDQVATRVDTNKSTGSAAALSVKAERQDGTWKIVELLPR